MNPLLEQHGNLLVDAEHEFPSPDLDAMLIKYVCNVPLDVLGNNVKQALARGVPRFFGASVPEKDGAWHVKWASHPIAIIGGGPTLRSTIERAKTFKTIMVAGSGYDYVVEHGIVPDYCVLLDAIPESIDWVRNPQKTTTYLLASQNSSEMFDHLAGYNCQLWHAAGLDDSYGDEPTIGGGSTATLRCIELAFLLGYWDQHFFGLDSCYLDDGTTHAYENWLPPNPLKVQVNDDRIFNTDRGLLGQAEVFISTFKERKKFMRATIHGDNLISEWVRRDHGEEGIRVA